MKRYEPIIGIGLLLLAFYLGHKLLNYTCPIPQDIQGQISDMEIACTNLSEQCFNSGDK